MVRGVIKYMCNFCKDKFPFESIRYARNGKSLVCISCNTKSSKPETAQTFDAASKKPELFKVICVDCRYKFSLKKKRQIAIRCPYCGGWNITRDETTAERLLAEISKEG